MIRDDTSARWQATHWTVHSARSMMSWSIGAQSSSANSGRRALPVWPEAAAEARRSKKKWSPERRQHFSTQKSKNETKVFELSRVKIEYLIIVQYEEIKWNRMKSHWYVKMQILRSKGQPDPPWIPSRTGRRNPGNWRPPEKRSATYSASQAQQWGSCPSRSFRVENYGEEKHEKSISEIRKKETKTCELGNIPEKVNNCQKISHRMFLLFVQPEWPALNLSHSPNCLVHWKTQDQD